MTRRLQHLSAIFRDGAHRLSDQSPRARVRETYAKLLRRQSDTGLTAVTAPVPINYISIATDAYFTNVKHGLFQGAPDEESVHLKYACRWSYNRIWCLRD